VFSGISGKYTFWVYFSSVCMCLYSVSLILVEKDELCMCMSLRKINIHQKLFAIDSVKDLTHFL
jgi:hypothetical protein